MATEAITVRCSFHVLLCMQGRNLRDGGYYGLRFYGASPGEAALGQPGDRPPVLCVEDSAGPGGPGGLGGRRYDLRLRPGSGMRLYFAEAVLRLQEQAEGISLEAWIPCPEQPNRWKEPDQARYRTLLSPVQPGPCGGTGVCPGCMLRRNRAMLQAADWLISVYDGSGGGTGAAVAYANRLGLPVEAIWL